MKTFTPEQNALIAANVDAIADSILEALAILLRAKKAVGEVVTDRKAAA